MVQAQPDIVTNNNFVVDDKVVLIKCGLICIHFTYAYIPYTGEFLRSQIFANRSKLRCEPYKLFDLCA